jgi:hypothetical protein
MWLTCREAQGEALGFCVPWGNRASGAAWRLVGYSFPPLSGEPGFLALWWEVSALLLSGTVGSFGPPCSVGREASCTGKIAKPGAWGTLRCVVVGSWHWVASWGYPWDSKASRLKSAGGHKAAETLRSTCVGAWASRSHGNCCRDRRPKSIGSESPESYLLVPGYHEPQQLL